MVKKMHAFWWLPFLFVLTVQSTALNKIQREKICSKSRSGCLWINPFFNTSRGFPIHSSVDFDNYLEVYCYDGPEPFSVKGLANVWYGLQVVVKCRQDVRNVQIFFSNKSSEIDQSEDKLTYRDALNRTFYHIAKPYDVFCVGVLYTGRDFVNYDFHARLEFMWRFPVLLAVGVVLLFKARNMSRSVLFHYGTGVTLGVVASILILLFFLSKILPMRNWLGVGVLAGGVTLTGSFLYWLYRHSLELLFSMWQYVILYIFLSATVSFAVMYRLGPVENPRTINLIQWSIQLVALLLIALASQLPEVGLVFVAMAMISYIVPAKCNPIIIALRLISIPFVIVLRPIFVALSCLLAPFTKLLFKQTPRFRFLTMEEYDEQGRSETKKALDELRKHCTERDGDLLKTLGKLRHARRFSQFLSGDDHVTDQERVDYDWSFVTYSTDESDEEGEGGGGGGEGSLDDSGGSSHFYLSPSSHDTSTHSTSFHYTSDDSPSHLKPHPSPNRAPLHGRRTRYV